MKRQRKQILEEIRESNGGILRPQDVVKAARPKDHPLHSAFEWDNTKAASGYRIWQARELIRVTVNVVERTQTTHRMYVSLTNDRNPDGGYRALADVVSDVELRRQMLEEALVDLERLELKYSQLEELAHVFEEANKIRKKAKKK